MWVVVSWFRLIHTLCLESDLSMYKKIECKALLTWRSEFDETFPGAEYGCSCSEKVTLLERRLDSVRSSWPILRSGYRRLCPQRSARVHQRLQYLPPDDLAGYATFISSTGLDLPLTTSRALDRNWLLESHTHSFHSGLLGLLFELLISLVPVGCIVLDEKRQPCRKSPGGSKQMRLSDSFVKNLNLNQFVTRGEVRSALA
jgi:hypothetical protein